MRLVRVIQRPTDAELPAEAMMDALDAYVRELARGAGVPLEEVRGVGAAFPSHVDFAEGVLLETADLYQLNDTPVRDMLKKRLALPVFIDNDSNAAALAEHRLGAGRGVRDMIYVAVSTGVGGGLILGGELYRGIHGSAGEIGHMFVSDSTGYPCGCGVSGCCLLYTSSSPIFARAAARHRQRLQGNDFCSGKWDFPTQKSPRPRRTRGDFDDFPNYQNRSSGTIKVRKCLYPLALPCGAAKCR